MPSRDETGKALSGYAGRKRAAEKRAAYAKATADAHASGHVVPSLDAFLSPPPEDTAQLVSWAARLLGSLLWQAYRDPGLRGIDRYRIIGQLTAQLGMLRDKASEQERLAKLARKHGLTTIKTGIEHGLEPLAGTIKPPTARGYRTDRNQTAPGGLLVSGSDYLPDAC